MRGRGAQRFLFNTASSIAPSDQIPLCSEDAGIEPRTLTLTVRRFADHSAKSQPHSASSQPFFLYLYNAYVQFPLQLSKPLYLFVVAQPKDISRGAGPEPVFVTF